MKNNGKSFGKGKFLSFKNYKKDFKKKDVRESSPPQGIVCYEMQWTWAFEGVSELFEREG